MGGRVKAEAFSCCRCSLLASPVKRTRKDWFKIPVEYRYLMDEYRNRLGLERRDSLIEILLAFNAFQGTVLNI